MKLTRFGLHLWWRILSFLVLVLVRCFGLNRDGALLLSLKHSVLSDPLSALESWNYYNETPCSWRGVRCSASGMFGDPCPRVVALSLADSGLLGSIPGDLGMIEHLQNLDLSGNAFNGTLPFSLFNASQLQVMDLSDNLISGELPEFGGGLQSLQLLNLSDNAFAGRIPGYLSALSNLTSVSLKNNYFSGGLPTGFSSVEVLDLSSNLINGSLPSDFGGESLRYLNISYNRLSGGIPLEFAQNIPESAVLDLSFNNLTGEIPESNVLSNQETKSFGGNTGLCGKPTKVACPIPSTPYNSTDPTSPPAIAAMPKTIDSTPETTTGPRAINGSRENGLRPATIVGIVVGDIAGVGILAAIILYVYQWKKQRKVDNATKTTTEKNETNSGRNMWSSSSSSPGETTKGITAWSCLPKRGEEEEESTETTSSEAEEERTMQTGHSSSQRRQQQEAGEKGVGALVTVDGGEKELELETLLKASAYILGATGTSIMYKAVLEDGTTLAVRRIGESGVERFRDFENQVKTIAKLVHPNLVRIRGFYWGLDEKLVIYDFVPNGSLASARYRKIGSSPCHMPWEIRLKVAKGVARALNYLHEKKHVHGNLKPSNILLGADMDPKIGDFGLERLVSGETSYKAGASARNFGSKRSTASRDSFQEVPMGPGPSPSPSPSSLGVSPYHAPESLRSLKPNPKWDVFSFGVILLELLTGKVVVSDDLGLGLAAEDKSRVLRMADAAIRADLEGREEALLACFKLGFNCVSPAPQKRPSMKDAVQVLDKIPSSSSSSSSYYYAH